MTNICWFELYCTGLEETDFEEKRLGSSTLRLPIENLHHGNSDQSTRDVVEIRVERIAAEFIIAPFAGKDCPLVCVHPEDAVMFDILHPERSRYIIVGHNHLVAGIKKALAIFSRRSQRRRSWNICLSWSASCTRG